MSILWKKYSTKGAVASMVTGTLLSIILILLSPTVWVDLFGNETAIFPWKNPALISLPAAFAAGIIVSLLSKEESAREAFEKEKLRTYLGVGAE
jgi:cation/acetate symporter